MKLIISLFILIFSLNTLYSQNIVSIRDTTVDRAILNKIPIYGKIDEPFGSSIDLCFRLNSLVIDIKDVVVDEFTIFEKIDSRNTNFNNFINSELTIESSGIRNNNYGILFYLLIEGLAGNDTTTLIVPNCLIVNDSASNNINFISGRINVRSTPVDFDFKEGLGLNSPNPFYNQTTIPFTIENNTKVSFNIYSLNGRKVINKSFENAGFDFEILDSKGIIIGDADNHNFEKGKYKLILKADNWKASAGAYYLIMTTSNSTYKINLMLIK